LHITSDLKRKGRFPPSPNDITHTIWFELDKLINIFNYGIPNVYNWENSKLKQLISIKLISNIFKILGLAFNGRIEDRLTRAPQIFAATTRLHPDVFGFENNLRGGKNIKQLNKPKKPTVKPKKPTVKPKKPTVKPKKPTVKPKKPSVKPKKPTDKPKKPTVKPKKPTVKPKKPSVKPKKPTVKPKKPSVKPKKPSVKPKKPANM
jgi:hypothetical protein